MTSRPRTDGAIQWLLDGDPAIRWQALRDVVGAAERTVERERKKVARDGGWGARLLARQDPEGTWAGGLSSDGGLYSPKWISTTYTMLLLRDFGLPASNRQARKACTLLLDRGLQRDGGINYGWRGRAKRASRAWCCPSSPTSSMTTTVSTPLPTTCSRSRCPTAAGTAGAHLAPPTLRSIRPSASLEGLRLYELHRGRKVRAVRAAQQRGREFLLVHRLFRSHRTGEIIKPIFTRFSFPPRWHYDILRALDYFQAVNAPSRPAPCRGDRHRPQQPARGRPLAAAKPYKGKTYFELERLGAPSRWNTLRALRVLKWWNRGRVLQGSAKQIGAG